MKLTATLLLINLSYKFIIFGSAMSTGCVNLWGWILPSEIEALLLQIHKLIVGTCCLYCNITSLLHVLFSYIALNNGQSV